MFDNHRRLNGRKNYSPLHERISLLVNIVADSKWFFSQTTENSAKTTIGFKPQLRYRKECRLQTRCDKKVPESYYGLPNSELGPKQLLTAFSV